LGSGVVGSPATFGLLSIADVFVGANVFLPVLERDSRGSAPDAFNLQFGGGHAAFIGGG
jgi:hypothetical protein